MTSQRKTLIVITLAALVALPSAATAQRKKKLTLAELAALEWKLEQSTKALTTNPGVDARKKAIEELLSTKDPRAVKPMAMALKEDPDPGVRLKATEGLGTIKSPETLGLLRLASTADPDPGVRAAAAALVKKFPRRMKTAALPLKARPFDAPAGKLSSKLIKKVLAAPSGDARLWAVRQIGKLKFKGRVKLLETHLKQDPSGRVRVEAARLLVKIRKKKSLPALIGVVADGDPAVRFELARLLSEFDDAGALSVLEKLAAADENETVKAEAKDLLEPSTRVGKRLLKNRIQMLTSENPATRIQAINSLIGFTHWRAMVPMSCALLNDKSVHVRTAAIKILPDMHDTSVLTALRVAAVLEPDAKLKKNVRKAIVALAKKVGGLIKQLSSKKVPERVRAARALGQGAYPQGLDPLIRALKDKSPKVRLAAVKGLRNFVSEKADNALKIAGADSDRRVRRFVDRFFKKRSRMGGWHKFYKNAHRVITWTVDKNAQKRLDAAYTLGVSGSEAGEHSLALLLKNDKVVDVRLAAAWALVLMGSEKAEAALKHAAEKDKSEKVRLTARKYLIITKVSREDLIVQLQDEKASARQDAAEALSLMANSKVMNPLIRTTLCDSNPRARAAALRGLTRIGKPLARTVIRVAMMRDLNDRVRRTAMIMHILTSPSKKKRSK